MKEENNIYLALLEVQKAMPVVPKTEQGHNAKFAPLDKIWKKVSAVINKNNFVVSNKLSPDAVETIATYVPTGEQISSSFPLTQPDPQKRGAEITYGRRYNLCAIFNIMVEKDDDLDSYPATKKVASTICPSCGKTMVRSKQGSLYCKGKYDGTCPPTKKVYKTEAEQKFADELTYEN